jgi:hypothetical protein
VRVARLVGKETAPRELASDETIILRFREISTRLDDIDDAERELRGALLHEALHASHICCDLVRHEHERRALALASAAAAVYEALSSYCELADELRRKDIRWAQLGSAMPDFLEHPRAHPNDLRLYLKEQAKLGRVTAPAVPERAR